MRASGLAVLLVAAGAALTTGACAGSEDGTDDGSAAVSGEGHARLCAAVRGNGQSIVTHFASLSRIVEHYGVLDGIAGGSSGSITTFVYDSILAHPKITTCGAAPCSESEAASRVALALKSVQGYGEAVVDSPEGAAVLDLASLGARLKQELDSRGILGVSIVDTAKTAAALTEVLSIPEIRGLLNPQLLTQLGDVAHLSFHVAEVKDAVTTIGAFSVPDNRLLFRTGAINWNELALLFGRVGDFYAGVGAAEPAPLGGWLDVCAPLTDDKPWDEAAKVPTGGKLGAATCGEAFAKIVADYRAKARASSAAPARLSAKIGDGRARLRKLVATAVVEGPSGASYKTALASYQRGEHPSGDVPFAMSFSDLKFGYWGAAEDTTPLVTAAGGSPADAHLAKGTSLGDATWKDILTRSPAEPGLAALVPLPDGRFSAGGWGDLAPASALKAIGCDHVVYVTRQDDEGNFAMRIAAKLGMTPRDYAAIYDLSVPTSAFNVSLEAADAVWCTNWNAFADAQQREMALDAWGAPLEVHAGFDAVTPRKPYDKASPRVDKPGCTPHVSGGAKFPVFDPSPANE